MFYNNLAVMVFIGGINYAGIPDKCGCEPYCCGDVGGTTGCIGTVLGICG
jgi:hypothetical protein